MSKKKCYAVQQESNSATLFIMSQVSKKSTWWCSVFLITVTPDKLGIVCEARRIVTV